MSRHDETHAPLERVSIQEASRRLNKSEKTIRRWVHTGKLHPVTIEGKFMFAVSELHDILEAEKPGPTLEERMTALEERVTDLQATLDEMKAKLDELSAGRTPYQQKAPPVRILRESAGPATSLPDGLIALSEMVKRHHVPETSVRRAVEHGALPVVRGSWPGGVKQAIDAEGHAKFYELYHERPGFQRCEACPHE